MCISTQIVDCQLNLVLNQKSDRLEIPLQSLTLLFCRLWANSILKVRHTNHLHVPQHIQVGRHHQTHSLQLNKSRSPLLHLCHWRAPPQPGAASAPKPTSHPHWPHSPRIPTGSPTQSPHSAPHSLPNPPKSTISALTSKASISATTASSTAPSRATTSSYSVHLTLWNEMSKLDHKTKLKRNIKLTAESLVAEGDDTKA
ncbi:unnamed protein product [Microthlaspi erraticum]|uniref:Uncharacterized protein n=1 Tax=Microthlaspi erraticum TaxID=1685480 RepID=A0A6D2IP10_9BRAS|nr:unnamed protein product [Microthlaspi erraticum]